MSGMGKKQRAMSASRVGTVYLVGAGPGDPGLLTLRAAELLRTAEVLAHDALIPPAILELAPAGAERIAVGRRGGHGSASYRLHPAVLERALQGKDVVRLKAGDPFVFGRGGEEAEELARHGIPFQVVPGITAALGAAAYAGIPLTHRDRASDVILASGHDAGGAHSSLTDWRAMAQGSGTLALYMALSRVRANVARLISGGRAPETPAACVLAATWPQQRVIVGTLADLAERVEGLDAALPALILVGDVVRLSGSLAWRERCPLHGGRILVARARPGRSRIAAALRALGAEVSESPGIEAVPPPTFDEMDAALERIAGTAGSVFACAAAVDAVSARLAARGMPRAMLQAAPVIAVGAQAAERLAQLDIAADRALPGACAQVLSDDPAIWTRGPLQLFTGGEGRPALLRELSALGAVVRPVTTYALRASPLYPLPGRLDLVVCASSSAVRAVLAFHAGLRAVPALAIGPRTEQALRELGAANVTRTEDDTVESVVEGALRRLVAPAARNASGGQPPGAEAGGDLDRGGQPAAEPPEAAP